MNHISKLNTTSKEKFYEKKIKLRNQREIKSGGLRMRSNINNKKRGRQEPRRQEKLHPPARYDGQPIRRKMS